MKRLLVAALLTMPTLLANAVWAAGPIVDTAFVVEAVERGTIIWDVRDAAQYRKGHLPGAVNIGDAGLVLRNANTEDFIPVDQIEKLLGGAGIDPAREIIVYASRGNPYAYFGAYTIQYFGGAQVRVYHDGIDGWRSAKRPVTTGDTPLSAVVLKLSPNPAVVATTEQVLTALKSPGAQIVDVRSPKEFSAEDIRAIRGGHIPGAVNIPYEMNWVDPDTGFKLARRQVPDNSGMALKPAGDLRKLYAGLDPTKETVVYCQSGIRAAETATVLAQLGFKDVKVYDSSWLGYAGVLSAPANNETFFNVGAFSGRLSSMQMRIEELERELAAAKAAK